VSDYGDSESLMHDTRLGVVLGSELARRLAAEPGESLRLMVLGLHQGRPHFRYRSVELAGVFTTGFSEFDEAWAITDRDELIRLAGGEVGSSLIEIALQDPDQADVVAEEVRTILQSDFLVTHWRDLNRELFTALEVQQIALFFVLGLIVLVSTFNVASSLVVLVREKMRDIGSLAAIGLSPSDLRWVFLFYGLGLGLVGTIAGIAVGALASWVLTEFELIQFEPELAAIYFISSVPFRVELLDILAVAAFSLTVTLVACWIPARRAAAVLPATALRYE
jgi:lipoprotein-releasing system permease protein